MKFEFKKQNGDGFIFGIVFGFDSENVIAIMIGLGRYDLLFRWVKNE